MKDLLFFVSIVFIVTGCGAFVSEFDSESDSKQAIEAPTSLEAADEDELTSDKDAFTGTSSKLSGYVQSAFEIEVDGEPFLDIEDFYSREIDRLPGKIADAGYEGEYIISLEGQLGLKDLWEGMDVYISANGERGHLGRAKIARSGKFEVLVPDLAVDQTFKIRANKRITITFRDDSEAYKICYNFSAIDSNVAYDAELGPIIISKFETRVTKYSCAGSGSEGLVISSKTKDENPYLPISKGMEKSEVLSALGDANLSVVSSTKWCWFSSGPAKANACAQNTAESCQCFVEFDTDGNLIDQSNIDTNYLIDVTEW